MNSKYCGNCGAELPEEAEVCPSCGEAVKQAQAAPEAPETVIPAAPEASKAPEQKTQKEKTSADAAKSERKKTAWILSGAIAVLVIIIAMLAVKIARDAKKPEVLPDTSESQPVEDAEAPSDEADDTQDPTSSTGDGESTEIPLNGISYTVTEDALTEDVLSRIVATCGDETLTNRDLPIYYWQQYFSFANSYGMYLSYIMDTSKALDQQMYDNDNTWQQMFLQSALDTFRYHSAMAQEAEANGFQLSADSEANLASMPDDLASAAAAYGFDSADAYLQASFGPSVTTERYLEFMRRYLLGAEYLTSLAEAQQPTDAEISQYYDDNADTYEENHVEKIDKPMISVRHILIQPEQAEDGTITDEAWAAAEQKANDILDQWLAGDRTEDSFADLANENSEDPGSNTTGGLYENVYPGQMVDEFNDWCFADGRKAGDYGIVKTTYGYHIMFFSAVGDDVYWFQTAKEDYLSEKSMQIEDEIVAKYSFTSDVTQSALVDVQFGGSDEAAE